MSTGPKPDNRGGRRPGAGRKPETLSVLQIREMREEAKKRAAREGRSLFEVVLDLIYDPALPARERLMATKLYLDKMLVAVKEGGEADREGLGPSVYLPEQRPILEAIAGGKKTDAA